MSWISKAWGLTACADGCRANGKIAALKSETGNAEVEAEERFWVGRRREDAARVENRSVPGMVLFSEKL
jgi:hypothetical protein